MVGTISPVVYGPNRVANWYRDFGIYTTSQVAAAALMGALLSTAGMLLRIVYLWPITTVVAALGLLAAIGAMDDMKLLPFRLPTPRSQVPQRWKRFPRSITVALYGFGIGLGLLTKIPFGGFYVLLLACVGLASMPDGIAIMTLYGLSRTTTTGLVARGQQFIADPHARLDRFTRLTPLVGYLHGIVLASIAGFWLTQFLFAHP